MADHSAIEWTDATWNPTVGCSILSPGCTNCYAMKTAHSLERRFGSKKYGGLTKVVNSNAVWTGEVRLDEDALLQPLKWKRGRRIFVNSMSDLFHESLPDEAIDKVFAVMALCPQHTFQVLTKRAERMREYFGTPGYRLDWIQKAIRDVVPAHHGAVYDLSINRRCENFLPLPNVWLGVSCERQQEADERIPLLLQTPAAVRFISAEPLLGAIDLSRCGSHYTGSGPLHLWRAGGDGKWRKQFMEPPPEIDWVIAGGESGPKARPAHPDWFRSLRDQCQAAGVAFFFKQWGEWAPCDSVDVQKPHALCGLMGNGPHIERDWLRTHDFLQKVKDVEGAHVLRRVGKKAAGRLLDGRTHDEFPKTEPTRVTDGAVMQPASPSHDPDHSEAT